MDNMPTLDQIRVFDQPGPRYTSYPTADHFAETFGPDKQAWWLDSRRAQQPARPVTVYVHIPFCESICHYCACNRIGTRDHSRAAHYLQTLQQEIRLYAARLTSDVRISQLHLGGGTPTFFSDEQLALLLRSLDTEIGFTAGAERSIEIDPRTVDAQRLDNIRTMGFERISFGVQDLDSDVQVAIHRIQPESMVVSLMQHAQTLDFRSINIDLVYGLPRQTLATLGHTLERIAGLNPGRMAIYGYAHLPSRFKAQRLINGNELPDQTVRMQMVHLAISKLNEAGYHHIGMDHFARADDDLAQALARGTLRRNFMGYTSMPGDDLIGLGVSSISAIGPSYAQNHRELKPWRQAIEAGVLPTARGIELTQEDILQRAVIMDLMCQGRIDFRAVGTRYQIDAASHFRHEMEGVQHFVDAGLVQRHADGIQVTPLGRYFLRSIAMVFDRHGRLRRRQREEAQAAPATTALRAGNGSRDGTGGTVGGHGCGNAAPADGIAQGIGCPDAARASAAPAPPAVAPITLLRRKNLHAPRA